MFGQIAKTVKVANAEAMLNSVFLSVGKLVENRTEVWHHVVRLKLGIVSG